MIRRAGELAGIGLPVHPRTLNHATGYAPARKPESGISQGGHEGQEEERGGRNPPIPIPSSSLEPPVLLVRSPFPVATSLDKLALTTGCPGMGVQESIRPVAHRPGRGRACP